MYCIFKKKVYLCLNKMKQLEIMENLHFSSDLFNHLKSGKQVVLNNKKLYKDKLTGFYFIRTKTGLLFEYKLLSDAIVFMNE